MKATKQFVNIYRIIPMFVRISSLRIFACFLVLYNSAIGVLSGTSVINCFIRDIFPRELPMVPWDSRTVSIHFSFQTLRFVVSYISVLDMEQEHVTKSDDLDHDEEGEELHPIQMYHQVRKPRL